MTPFYGHKHKAWGTTYVLASFQNTTAVYDENAPPGQHIAKNWKKYVSHRNNTPV